MSDSNNKLQPLCEQKITEFENQLGILERSASDDGLIAVLLTRDQVREAIQKEKVCSDNALQRLVRLDQRLNSFVVQSQGAVSLPDYRRSFSPKKECWWWYIDQKPVFEDEKNGLLWTLGTFLIVTVTAAFTLDIIKYLWRGTPDIYSFLGTLLTLILTSSAFTDQGTQIGRQLLKRMTRLPRQSYTRAKFIMAAIAALLVLMIWHVGVPQLSRFYHNKGMTFISSEPAEAKKFFQRATSLSPGDAPSYYELGRLYEDAGQIKQATESYQKSLENDFEFIGAYIARGRMHVLHKEYQAAIWTSLAGLRRVKKGTAMNEEEKLYELETEYKLLQNLGWAYYAHGRYFLAREQLENAVKLEKRTEDSHGIEPEAPVHYFLALTLDALGKRKLACLHWDTAYRYFPDTGFLYTKGWERVFREKYQQCNPGE